jgi:dihydrofolate reductase
MGKIVVFENLTLDGVMQAPGRPDEDRRGGFRHGGWAAPYADPGPGSKIVGETMTQSGALLLGRRTYEDFYAVWHGRTDGNPYTPVLDNSPKYVASTTLKEPLVWMNSALLKGDVPGAVAELKAQPGKDMVVLGSGELAQTLMQHNLVDRYVLLIHPLILGSGRRLFADGSAFTTLRLIDTETTATGVLIATYQAAAP